jgi:mono/diheme cytochrome c family protein
MGSFRMLVAGCALASLASGCSSLPQPTVEDVSRAQTRVPDVTLEKLTQGRKTYVGTCSGCHALHLPTEFPPQRWPALLDEMQVVHKVKLSGEQRKQIEEFLVAMAR